jgi:hypothetical protein
MVRCACVYDLSQPDWPHTAAVIGHGSGRLKQTSYLRSSYRKRTLSGAKALSGGTFLSAS